MRRILISILLVSTICFIGSCELCFGQEVIHRHSNCTVYEYNIPGPVPGCEFNEASGTWVDTCWVGTEGYMQGKAKPKVIRRTIIKEGNLGVAYYDSSAFYGLQAHILAELANREELEVTLPNGNVQKVNKSKNIIPGLRNAANKASVNSILAQIIADPAGVQIYGVYALKEKSR